jgi:ABC-type Fe3+ transport system substrate-binding protein
MKMTRFAFPELKLTRRHLAAAIFTSIATSTSIGFAAKKINIYSHQQQVLIQPFPDAFTAKTGIGTNVVYSSKGLAQRLKAEGPASPADVILTEEKAQHLYGEINFEYPVNPAVSVNVELASWGRFKPDSLPIQRLAALAPKAQMIIDRVGW